MQITAQITRIGEQFIAANHIEVPSFQSALDAYAEKKTASAIELLQTILRHNPQDARVHHLRGLCHFDQGNLGEAESAIRTALTIVKDAEFYGSLGRVLRSRGNLYAAAQAYESSLSLAPGSASVCNNLANVMFEFARFEEAIDLYRRAVNIQPDFALALKNMGQALMKVGRLDEAEVALRKAVDLREDFFDAQKPLAMILIQTGRIDEARAVYKWWGMLQFEMRKTVQWEDLPTAEDMYLSALKVGEADPLPPFRVLFVPGMTPQLEQVAARNSALFEIPELQQPPIVAAGTKLAGDRPLRIGYLSSDFHNHATMHLLAGVLEAHETSDLQFEIFSYGPPVEDEFTRRLKRTRLPIIDVSNPSNQQAAQIIRQRQIDILVELKGYTGSARLGISALRPAPIIVNWLGYPGSLGHERLADYIIGDPIVTPPEFAGYYSERLALMPNAYQPNDLSRPLSSAPSRTAAGLPDLGLIFSSFNQALKFNPQTFDIWGRLLEAVPDSVLWLSHPHDNATKANILREFHARRVSSDRIVFAPLMSQAAHMARLRLADLALDTFPYNSHTTASDALWTGVPLVTMRGETFASRVASSLLTTHGFPELITESEEEYFNLALALATDEKRRIDLKWRIEQARLRSPLFDTLRFTRDLENLYRAIAADHNQPAEHRAPVVRLT